MYLADVMISKVGGLSSSESLACGLPIIAIAAIPGQEARNTKFLLDNGVGFKIKKPKDVTRAVSSLISDKSQFLKLKEKISNLAKPNAAEDIARLALQNLK